MYNHALHRTMSVCALNHRRASIAHPEVRRDHRRCAKPFYTARGWPFRTVSLG